MAKRRSSLARIPSIAILIAALVAATGGLNAGPQVIAAAATSDTGSITLAVQSARSVADGPGYVHEGDPISEYKWLINADDTGNPGTAADPLFNQCLPSRAVDDSGQAVASSPDFADSCPWPSTRKTSGAAPIIAQGDQTDLNEGQSLENLPPGKYLISVTAADYKIDGTHFTVTAGATQLVTVGMNPYPLPLQTIRLQVFEDNAPVDGTWEVDAENGMAGFTATLADVYGLVSVDYYGNALCTKYQRLRPNGTLVPEDSAPDLPVAFADGRPVIDPSPHLIVPSNNPNRRVYRTGCVSNSDGEIVIPNLGPNRYGATVTKPHGSDWLQTTTLEGGHDHDVWQQEGQTGFDTEQLKGGEPVPYVHFGFVHRMPTISPDSSGDGEIKGVAVIGLPYIGGQNGQVVPETGVAGAKLGGPVKNPWIALSNLGLGDQQVYTGRGDSKGRFSIKNVADGTYQLTIWDEDQDLILWSFNVTVEDGETVDVGNEMLVGWFTHIRGRVFVDTNGNGKMDKGEAPVPAFTLTLRERDNTLMDQYANTFSTNDKGVYDVHEAYPIGKWLIVEAFNTRYMSTGITYRADNEKKSTTLLGAAVDINVLDIIGLGGQIDWGVQPYERAENGGIVGTVSYDTTRNELDPAVAASETYNPGIPDVPVRLWAPERCTTAADATPEHPATPAALCRQGYVIDATTGAFVKAVELQDAYTSETWEGPRGCTARMYNGAPLSDQQALPAFGKSNNQRCLEAPMMGFQVGASDTSDRESFGQTVNGNYGFGDTKVNQYATTDSRNPGIADGHPLAVYAPLHCGVDADDRDSRCAADADYDYDNQPLLPNDYLVSVDIPANPVGGKPMYQVTREEDVNVFDGDSYLPQQNYPPTIEEAADAPAGATPTPVEPSQPPSQQGGLVSQCGGDLHTVHVTNQAFLDGGGSPFEGLDRPLCDTKLVTVRGGQATAPNFNLFTEVPLPTHFWGLTINDLGLSLDKRSINFGEAQGLPFVPVGLYDYTGRLKDTVSTDFNGMYEALEPSTATFNCPVPAGPCPNMYRFVGNDPGRPGHLNANYNSRFRTIATNFQAWPGQFTVTDTAPTQVASTVLTPGATVVNTTACDLGATAPQILAVSKPYVRRLAADNTVVITGSGFGATQGAGAVTLTPATGTAPVVTTTAWSDTSITFTVPTTLGSGPVLLAVNSGNGQSTVNGLTLQVIDPLNTAGVGTAPGNPRLAEVGPGRQFATIQAALEAAIPTNQVRYWLVVVWPGTPTADNPHGEYTENIVVHHQVRIQGVGPGGFDPSGHWVPGSIIDGAGFNPDNPADTNWFTLVSGLRHSGDPTVPDAAVVTVLDDPNAAGVVPPTYPLAIDGFRITGGAQSDFATNIGTVNGSAPTPAAVAGSLITQGGGVYVHANVIGLRLTDNVIAGNGGSYGGAVRLGTPYIGNNRNYGLQLLRNQIRDNGGTNLAGGIGLFAGSDGYNVSDNAICGNFSAEYGGAISAFGYQVHNNSLQPTARIANNRMWFNMSYDEGGALFVGGELPNNPDALSEGTGPVQIDANVIQANLSNDDGGGIRLLQTSGSHITHNNPETISITNNIVANNISTHEGGGIALDDAAFVTITNNTIVRNLTTASAVTSNGLPAPAGLSTAGHSQPLLDRLNNQSLLGIFTPFRTADDFPSYSDPTLLNNVFWDNRAGTFEGGYVYGIGGTLPDGTDNWTDNWDLGSADDASFVLHPRSSVLQTIEDLDGNLTTDDAPGNVLSNNPVFVSTYDVTVNVLASRMNPAFRQSVIVAQILPPSLMGNYHLRNTTSPAYAKGSASQTVTWGSGVLAMSYVVSAPSADIDNNARPTVVGSSRRYDAGADQYKP
ncbi:MAG: pectin lyase-like protein [Frankiales bacterium]|nr:pectin lyase-like protein [Frankiales bacterium]